jgi:hypothetical protein
MQSTSISINQSSLIRFFISTNVQAGRILEKNSPCAFAAFSHVLGSEGMGGVA